MIALFPVDIFCHAPELAVPLYVTSLIAAAKISSLSWKEKDELLATHISSGSSRAMDVGGVRKDIAKNDYE